MSVSGLPLPLSPGPLDMSLDPPLGPLLSVVPLGPLGLLLSVEPLGPLGLLLLLPPLGPLGLLPLVPPGMLGLLELLGTLPPPFILLILEAAYAAEAAAPAVETNV